MGLLISHVPAHSNLDLVYTLKDMVIEDGSWNIELFHLWLSEDIVQHIISIPPPHPHEGNDN